jgi:hypothetical protein
LRAREVLRSTNNPVGDYCELLCCEAFGWTREVKSTKGHNGVDAAGVRYQIKGRRLMMPHNPSRQLGALHELEQAPLDVLAGVLLDQDFRVVRAALVPHAIVLERSTPMPRGGRRFHLRESVRTLPGVRDMTAELRAVRR